MRRKNMVLAWLVVGLFLFNSCSDDDSARRVKEIPSVGKLSEIVRSPVSADGRIDTVQVARMVFTDTVFDFDEVGEGAMVRHVFRFENTGKVPLVINNAQSTCGCTVPAWPREPVPPGRTGEIEVEFNTAGKEGFQEKSVTIAANTYPSLTRVYLRGYVNTRPAERNPGR
ncbi:MAG: hypothetical protein RLY31_2593 [Bacteroidota bacterium]|jgi:hypothetical protein